ncbi:hypothetical protein VUR80DRAFT_5838 [Thermomyces stellatus]
MGSWNFPVFATCMTEYPKYDAAVRVRRAWREPNVLPEKYRRVFFWVLGFFLFGGGRGSILIEPPIRAGSQGNSAGYIAAYAVYQHQTLISLSWFHATHGSFCETIRTPSCTSTGDTSASLTSPTRDIVARWTRHTTLQAIETKGDKRGPEQVHVSVMVASLSGTS